jgi:serine/threonine protein kinase
MIANKYKLETILSKGSYGFVYKGLNKILHENVAIKIEINAKSLQHETKILNYLYSNKIRKIPAIYWYGIFENHPCLVMTYYEYNLLDYIKKINNTICSTNNEESKKEKILKINQIMYKMLNIIMEIHNQFVLHRDLKPANFMIKNGELYLIDFGLASFYITDDQTHIKNEHSETLIGSPKYISIHIFDGNTYSRRDDLISLGYIYLMMVLNGTPWEDDVQHKYMLENQGKSTYEEIHIHHPKNKIRRTNRILSNMLEKYVGMYENITTYLKYVYELEYDEKPRYNYLSTFFE